MRLIDADKLMSDIEHYHLSDGKFQHWVEIQPTIEPERKKGKWLLIDAGYYDYVKCSQCGETLVWGKNFCPNCGADMREGEQE